ncbi:MAG TPA: methyltransferase domain-containing protein [Candidatus Macondimonas sp.]|nr:methyltransferase domain-containing protein [Candidatus Macondimonas sp.]
MDAQHQPILDYYRESHIDYQMIWGSFRHLGLHYGYHDAAHRGHNAAVLNMNRQVADRLQVQAGQRLVDAGCGIGGTSIWMAENRGADVTGVNISPEQLARARKLVAARHLQDRVRFVQRSYIDTGLPDAQFDGIYGMESVSYAIDKRDFIREAYRLLKPGGRLVITDGFRNDTAFPEHLRGDYQRWLDGWAVDNLAGARQFQDDLAELGFRNIRFEDSLQRVLPSSRRMHIAAKYTLWGGKLLEKLRIRTPVQTGNIIAAKLQYPCLIGRAWIYGIVTAVK